MTCRRPLSALTTRGPQLQALANVLPPKTCSHPFSMLNGSGCTSRLLVLPSGKLSSTEWIGVTQSCLYSSPHRTRSDLSADSSAVPSTWLEARCWSQPKRARDCSSHKPCTQSLPKACEYSETDWLIDNTEVSQSHVNGCDMIVSVSSPACNA